MNLDIRNYIFKNLSNESYDGIKKNVLEAVNSADESTLPGLGVMFELVWKSATDSDRDRMINSIASQIK